MLVREQLHQLRYFVLINDEPLNSATVVPPSFADLSGMVGNIDGPRGPYVLFENVVNPVWRREHAQLLHVDAPVPLRYHAQFRDALQTAWSQLNPGEYRSLWQKSCWGR